MKLKIPFLPSRGFECGQACVAMTIKYFYPDFTVDFERFNTLIRHKHGKYTYPTQNALLLDYFGVKTNIYSSKDLVTTVEEPDLFKNFFKKDYSLVKEFLDSQVHDWAIEKCRSKGLFKKELFDFDNLLDMVSEGKVVIIPLALNLLYAKEGPYDGHFVIISGYGDDYIFLHDPDEGPYIKFDRKIVKSAWEHPAIDNDFIVGLGKNSPS